MENHGKNKWIEEVFDSLQGMERAQPAPDLLGRIEQNIDRSTGQERLRGQAWLAIAAAVTLLVINLLATRQLLQPETLQAYERQGQMEGFEESLLSDYNFYEL